MERVIAIDFDGCLCENAYPDIGEPNLDVIYQAKVEQQNGAKLILWTQREGELLDAAVKTCKIWGLEFDAINDSLDSWKKHFGNNPRKIGATEYWDDKAVRKEYMPIKPKCVYCKNNISLASDLLKDYWRLGCEHTLLCIPNNNCLFECDMKEYNMYCKRHENQPEQPSEPHNIQKHRSICDELNRLYDAKNADYGDAFHTGYQKRGITMAIIRLEDKLSRLDRLTSGAEAQVKDESIRDTLIDLANYAILTVMELDAEKENE